MAIPTSRTKECARIVVDTLKCTGCGLCAYVCKDFSLTIKNGVATESEAPCFGCIGCGHCMAICPHGAITIEGRTISPSDLIELTDLDIKPKYEQIMALLIGRRSVREFKEREVEAELVEKILAAARSAPMGLPPSDVNVLIFHGKNRVNNFVLDFCKSLEKMKWLVSGWFLSIMRPFWGKSNAEMFGDFLRPLFNIYIDNMKKGENLVTYNAPLAIYFYGSPYTDPADPLIPATYAMLAGESLGLGTCMIGGVHPLIQNGSAARKLREKYGIKYKSKEGIFVIFGYPDVEYKKGILRTFASEKYDSE